MTAEFGVLTIIIEMAGEDGEKNKRPHRLLILSPFAEPNVFLSLRTLGRHNRPRRAQ